MSTSTALTSTSAAIIARAAYGQTRRKLVLAFDIGTTFSGISYSILDPGNIPEVKGVTRFPANELINGASKIPTIIYYDKEGNVQAVGAEATREGIVELAEDNGWVKAEWFKLHLRSKASTTRDISDQIFSLPSNKSVVDVFADFLYYLFQCAAIYIQDTHANGAHLWDSVSDNIDFVLSHPNGWEGREQGEMRRAMVMAGLVKDDTEGRARISFVTEGEASLHYAIQRGVLAGAIESGAGVIIVDAGGGTIDISAYRCDAATKTFEETAAPQCHFYGSIFVSVHCQEFLRAFLEGSPFLEDVTYIAQCFDKTTKQRFKSNADAQYIKFGSTRDNDPQYNIRFGQLRLSGTDVSSFFEPSVDCIINAVKEQCRVSPHKIHHVVLVGGFSASDWLLKQVQAGLSDLKLNVFRPEDYVNKAVSDGAVSFYIDHFVRVRVSKVTFGSLATINYNPNDADHVRRSKKVLTDVDGRKLVPNHFYIMLPKNTQIEETKEFRDSFSMTGFDPSHFQSVTNEVWCYRGNLANPKWKDLDPDNFEEFCTIEADLSSIPLTPQVSASGHTYYRVWFQIVLLFGLTEIEAHMAWEENGVERRGPATVMYTKDV
ncbi:unnamed protein product [Cyclocybe aegerita]|uniref:Uncharacterized protein n=1 Tax=Cyclocybe aegerita TaxID=1973307 RepID=A0A8S0VV22_CYCAE|nr:unnamed protein product [Cyclocybe aegerita]